MDYFQSNNLQSSHMPTKWSGRLISVLKMQMKIWQSWHKSAWLCRNGLLEVYLAGWGSRPACQQPSPVAPKDWPRWQKPFGHPIKEILIASFKDLCLQLRSVLNGLTIFRLGPIRKFPSLNFIDLNCFTTSLQWHFLVRPTQKKC